MGEALDEIKKQSRALQQETALQLEHEAAMHRRALHEERQAVMASVAADGVDDDISEAYANMKLEMTAAKSELVHLSEKMLLQLDSTREHAAGWQRGVSDLERQLSEQTEMYEGQVETLSAERRAQEGRAAEEVAALAAELAQRDAQLSAQDEQLRTLQAQLVESQAQHARGTSAAAEQARLCQRLRAEKAAETARAEAAEKRVRQLEVAEQSSERERDETGGKLQALRAEHRQAERSVAPGDPLPPLKPALSESRKPPSSLIRRESSEAQHWAAPAPNASSNWSRPHWARPLECDHFVAAAAAHHLSARSLTRFRRCCCDQRGGRASGRDTAGHSPRIAQPGSGRCPPCGVGAGRLAEAAARARRGRARNGPRGAGSQPYAAGGDNGDGEGGGEGAALAAP